jgi:soluble lytic murein transglycosylase-like protein
LHTRDQNSASAIIVDELAGRSVRAGIVCCPSASRSPLPVWQAASTSVRPNPAATAVSDAALRFGIPEQWIYVVMRAESAGRVNATSPAGALGLMQIMPGTWAVLTSRYGLGNDPYDPRANIMAGAAYIREMHDRYGAPGFLAAYNAGPGRYEAHLYAGRPLPAETRNYVAKIAPALDGSQRPASIVAAPSPYAWTRASLFAPRTDSISTDPATPPLAHVSVASQASLGGLFVALSSRTAQ